MVTDVCVFGNWAVFPYTWPLVEIREVQKTGCRIVCGLSDPVVSTDFNQRFVINITIHG